MKFNHNGIWRVLIDRNMRKDLINKTEISPTTISKMIKEKAVSHMTVGGFVNVLLRI